MSNENDKSLAAPRGPGLYTKKQVLSILVALVAFALPWVVEFPGLSPEGHRLFSIFLLAIVLWVTEAIPLHATAAVIIFLEIIMISNRSLLTAVEGFDAPDYSVFYRPLAHPVLMLFLGGFFLADGAAKYNVDKSLARLLLRPFGTKPSTIVLGLMLITALLSMFMSNTATTATMMAVVLPVIAKLPKEDRMRTALALCIPFAANVGGIGTPVGTPPNAIALGAMADMGIHISFVRWMAMAIPCVLIILFLAWQLLVRIYPSSQKALHLEIEATFDKSWQAKIYYFTAALTIILWLSEPLHGMKSTIVGFIPVVVLLSTRVFSVRDMQSIQWHVLWLVAGGIALGVGVSSTGLDQWLVGLVSWDTIGTGAAVIALCLVSLAMSTVISNSATANLIIPIGMSLATSGAVALNPMIAAFFIAIACSLAMALPISTPPNAIAYSTGAVKTKDMALNGMIIGMVGLLFFVKVAPMLWQFMGVMPK